MKLYINANENYLMKSGFHKRKNGLEGYYYTVSFPVYRYKTSVILEGVFELYPNPNKLDRYDVTVEVKTNTGNSYAAFYDQENFKTHEPLLNKINKNIEYYMKKYHIKTKKR